MTHPCLVTLDRDSAPRVLFAGDRLVEVDLPAGTRVLYPKPPIEPLKDVVRGGHGYNPRLPTKRQKQAIQRWQDWCKEKCGT